MIDGVRAVLTALDRTVAARSARITARTDHSWALPSMPGRTARGPVASAAIGIGRTAGKAVGSAVGKGILRLVADGADPRHLVGQGVLDLAGRRSMIDYGSYAVLQVGAQEWSGRSGRALQTLPPATPRIGAPLWLIDLAAGVTTAVDWGIDDVEGRRWRHLKATASLPEASSRHPDGMPSPARGRYEDLLELPLEVWLDDEHLRRICFVDDHRTQSVTLFELGVDTGGMDWSRLPDLA
ncbi:MAG: hypothetical protein ACRYG2_26905 [Janthinobacterium lividum]